MSAKWSRFVLVFVLEQAFGNRLPKSLSPSDSPSLPLIERVRTVCDNIHLHNIRTLLFPPIIHGISRISRILGYRTQKGARGFKILILFRSRRFLVSRATSVSTRDL